MLFRAHKAAAVAVSCHHCCCPTTLHHTTNFKISPLLLLLLLLLHTTAYRLSPLLLLLLLPPPRPTPHLSAPHQARVGTGMNDSERAKTREKLQPVLEEAGPGTKAPPCYRWAPGGGGSGV